PELERKLCVASFFFEGERPFFELFSEERRSTLRSLFSHAEKSDLAHCELVRPQDWNLRSGYSLELSFACKGASRIGFLPRLLKTVVSHKLKVGNLSLAYLFGEAEPILVLFCELHGATGAACWECTDIER